MITILIAFLIIIAVFLFNLMIFVHEFGHFFTAKLSGVKVNEFALGMGPVLFSKQKGDTKYSLRAFPIGGFCAMEGEDQNSDDESAFGNKALWKRIIIVSAGAIMNIILGFILMMVILVQQDYFASTTILKFTDNAKSIESGLQVGDKITSINSYKIITDKDLSFALATNKGNSMDMVVKRDKEKVVLDNVVFNTETADSGEEVLQLDFYVEPIKKTFFTLISQTFNDIISTIKMVWASLIGLIRGQFSFGDIAGPVGAVSVISEAASEGLQINFMNALNNVIMIMVIFTVNLGVLNLLPVPALDGGRLVFLFIEGIIGKPIPSKYESFVHTAGFVLLMMFMLIVTFSDVLRLFTGKGLGS